jgi:hypothetical protein
MRERIDYSELDPDEIEAREKAAQAAHRRKSTIAMQASLDAEELMKHPAFRRWFFTVLAKAGIYRAAFHPQEGAQHYDAGRRGLGIELLDELLRIDPQFAIDLSVEQAKLEEKVNDRTS